MFELQPFRSRSSFRAFLAAYRTSPREDRRPFFLLFWPRNFTLFFPPRRLDSHDVHPPPPPPFPDANGPLTSQNPTAAFTLHVSLSPDLHDVVDILPFDAFLPVVICWSFGLFAPRLFALNPPKETLFPPGISSFSPFSSFDPSSSASPQFRPKQYPFPFFSLVPFSTVPSQLLIHADSFSKHSHSVAGDQVTCFLLDPPKSLYFQPIGN